MDASEITTPDCQQCHHPWYDHLGWKAETPYAHNHSGCRIISCNCLSYVDSISYILNTQIHTAGIIFPGKLNIWRHNNK